MIDSGTPLPILRLCDSAVRMFVAVLLLIGTLVPVAQAQSARARAVRAEMASVLLQSRRYAEAAQEYRVLLAAEPRNQAHRLNLARALMWGGQPREAEREIQALMAQRGNDPALEAMLLDAREQIGASSGEAQGWLRQRPHVMEYRRLYARALMRERKTAAALVQYDTLVLLSPSNVNYLERARVHAARLEFDAAQRDLSASIQLRPTAEAYMMRGDLLRARGDFPAARAAYWEGRRVSNDVDLAAAIARLDRDERPVIGLLPNVYGDVPGWSSATSTTADNLGVSMTTTSLRRGLWFQGFDASVAARARHFAGPVNAITANEAAFGAEAAVAREASRGHMMGRVRARAGFLTHDSGMIPELGVAAVGFYRAWGAGFDLDVGAAYPELLTAASYFSAPLTGGRLTRQSSTISVGGPVSGIDVAASREHMALSDGNTRTTLQGLARRALTRNVALLYAGSAMSFAQSSADYWSPDSYVSHAAGPEFSLRRARGLSASLRLLPGIAFTSQPAVDTTPAFNGSAVQLTGAAALSYRASSWELGAGLSAGRGRSGTYQRVDGNVYLRYAP